MTDGNNNNSIKIKSRNQNLIQIIPRIIKYIYKDIDSFKISINHRKQINNNIQLTNHLTYGEISCLSFLQILQWIIDKDTWYNNNKKEYLYHNINKVFVDLGSGAGKACLTASLSITRIFTTIHGIEIIPELVEQANDTKDKLIELVNQNDSNNNKQLKEKVVISNNNNENKLINVLIDILKSNNNNSLDASSLANESCKVLGHKIFKSIIKKGFQAFINQHNNYFTMNGSKITLLNDNKLDDLSIEPIDKEITEIIIDNQTRNMILPLPTITYSLGSIFDYDWYSDCYIAFAASLLFSDEMMNRLLNQVIQMNHGSWLITLKPLPILTNQLINNRNVILESESFYKMSWEMCKVYIYKIVIVS